MPRLYSSLKKSCYRCSRKKQFIGYERIVEQGPAEERDIGENSSYKRLDPWTFSASWTRNSLSILLLTLTSRLSLTEILVQPLRW